MDLDRYLELRSIVQQWRLRLAASIRDRIEASPRWLRRLEAIYEREGAGEEFTLWLDRWCRQAAIQLILRILFLRVLEDRNLLGATRLRNADGQQMWRQLTRNLGAASYVQWCSWDAAHLLPDLFSPTDYDLVLPEDDLVQRFLDDVWRRPDSNRPNWLRFDFRPDPDRADAGFQTRFIGDLYQELDAEIRARYALLQTPDFISQFILEHTLLKRFEEKDFREVTLIDPTCGSGHLEVDAFWMFVARYEAAAGKTREQLTVVERTQIARTIVEQHLFGCDINPYATALTRFRLLLAACDYAQPASLRDLRDLRFNIVSIDSLIPYERLALTEWQAGGQMARALGQPDAIERALPILRRRYDVVVGNPPYILERDAIKRNLYRTHYTAASGKFNLSAPFTERFISLSNTHGRVGIIESNAFIQREFGRALIERVLPQLDLESIVDSSGAYIPGHGTPTVLLFLVKRPPVGQMIKAVICRRGEDNIPAVPSQGRVWRSIEEHYTDDQFENEYVEVTRLSREELKRHPWNLSPGRSLLGRIKQRKSILLGDLAYYLGPGCLTGADDVYLMTLDQARREGIGPDFVKWATRGEDIRDWGTSPQITMLLPYSRNVAAGNQLEPFDLLSSGAWRYLEQFRKMLTVRSPLPGGRKWFELCRSAGAEGLGQFSVAVAYLATHNHFVPNMGDSLYQRSGYSLRLNDDVSRDTYEYLLAVLNSSVICFYLKEICFNKGAGSDPVRDRYDFAGQQVGTIPLTKEYSEDNSIRRRAVSLAEDLSILVEQSKSIKLPRVFDRLDEAYSSWNAKVESFVASLPVLGQPFTNARSLTWSRDQAIQVREAIRNRMIFLQEEMDWLAYETYGLIKKAPMAEDYLTPSQYKQARLQLGQRPFEIAGGGYKGDLPPGYQPDPLPDYLCSLTEARIAMIESSPDIALLEDPLYKRRWVPPDYDKEFREAAAWWLAEKLEFALERHGKPISLQQWARLLARDERVNATLEVLTGSPMFDAEQELLKVMRANAVPNRPEHYLKPAGLRKFYAARQARLEAPDQSPPVPEYSSTEFSDATAWRLRGKLNIPRERFIAYAEFDHTQRGSNAPNSEGPWYGWDGWDAGQRADALAFLLDRANRAGWQVHYQQCGLRAALRELLPDLKKALPQGEYLEFEGIAGRCGMSLDTPCYCQAYRDGIAIGQSGVPGLTQEALDVKVVQSETKRPSRVSKKQSGNGQQLDLGID